MNRGLLTELERIRDTEQPRTQTEYAYRLALDYGIRVVSARLEWAEASAALVRSRAAAETG